MAFGLDLGRLVVRVEAEAAQYNKVIDEVEKRFDRVSRNLSTFGRRFSFAVSAPLAAFAARAVKAFSDMDSALTEAMAVMGDSSVEAREKMEAMARTLSLETRFSASQLAEQFVTLGRSGLDAGESVRALRTHALFAQAGMVELNEATELLNDALAALGVNKQAPDRMDELHRLANLLVAAANASQASIDELALSLTRKAGAALRLVNKDMEEGVALLSVYADQGLKGAIAGERVDIVLRDLNVAQIRSSRAWEELGITSKDAVTGGMRPLHDIIRDLEGALKGLDPQMVRARLMTLGFQQRSVAAVASLIGMSGELKRYTDLYRNLGEEMERVAQEQMQSFANQLQLLRNRITLGMEDIGRALAPMVMRTTKVVGEMFDLFRMLPRPIQTVVASLGLFSIALGPVVLGLGQLLFFGKQVGSAYEVLAGAFKKTAAVTSAAGATIAGAAAATTVSTAAMAAEMAGAGTAAIKTGIEVQSVGQRFLESQQIFAGVGIESGRSAVAVGTLGTQLQTTSAMATSAIGGLEAYTSSVAKLGTTSSAAAVANTELATSFATTAGTESIAAVEKVVTESGMQFQKLPKFAQSAADDVAGTFSAMATSIIQTSRGGGTMQGPGGKFMAVPKELRQGIQELAHGSTVIQTFGTAMRDATGKFAKVPEALKPFTDIGQGLAVFGDGAQDAVAMMAEIERRAKFMEDALSGTSAVVSGAGVAMEQYGDSIRHIDVGLDVLEASAAGVKAQSEAMAAFGKSAVSPQMLSQLNNASVLMDAFGQSTVPAANNVNILSKASYAAGGALKSGLAAGTGIAMKAMEGLAASAKVAWAAIAPFVKTLLALAAAVAVLWAAWKAIKWATGLDRLWEAQEAARKLNEQLDAMSDKRIQIEIQDINRLAGEDKMNALQERINQQKAEIEGALNMLQLTRGQLVESGTVDISGLSGEVTIDAPEFEAAVAVVERTKEEMKALREEEQKLIKEQEQMQRQFDLMAKMKGTDAIKDMKREIELLNPNLNTAEKEMLALKHTLEDMREVDKIPEGLVREFKELAEQKLRAESWKEASDAIMDVVNANKLLDPGLTDIGRSIEEANQKFKEFQEEFKQFPGAVQAFREHMQQGLKFKAADDLQSFMDETSRAFRELDPEFDSQLTAMGDELNEMQDWVTAGLMPQEEYDKAWALFDEFKKAKKESLIDKEIEGIQKQLETPQEAFNKRITDLNRLFGSGRMDADLAEREFAAAKDEFKENRLKELEEEDEKKGKGEIKFAGAFQQGSSEAFSQIIKSINQNRGVEAEAKRQTQVQLEMRQELRRIAEGVEGDEPAGLT